MGSRIYSLFSLLSIALVILLLFLAPSTEAKFKGINIFCRTADYRNLCTTMVGNATTLHDAIANALRSTLDVAEKMDKMLPVIEPTLTYLPSVSRKSTVETCKDNFDSAVDNIKEALDFLEQNDIARLNVYMSAVTTVDCIDAFKQFKTRFPTPVEKVARQLNKKVGICLAVSQQI